MKIKEGINLKEILIIFLSWRLTLFLIVIFSAIILPYRAGSDFTNILNLINTDSVVNSPVIYTWANFDGVHYLTIANYGYTFDARFFPLFPILINLFKLPVFSLWQLIAALLLTNLSFLASLVLLNKLLIIDYSLNISRKIVINLLIFPTAFFFVAIYSEGLFLLLLILSFYLARQKKWFWSSIAALLLTITRPVGILILPALFVEYLTQQNYFRDHSQIYFRDIKKIWSFLLIPLGIIFWSIFNYIKWGDFLYFIHNQGELNNGRSTQSVIFYHQTIFRYFKILTLTSIRQFEWWIALLEIGAFVFGSIMLYLAWKKNVRSSYLLFAILAFLISTLTGTFSGVPRYLIILFPVFIATALLKKPIFQRCYFIVSLILSAILLAFFSRGYYIS